MKAVERHIDEIKRVKEAMRKAESKYLKIDYFKYIKELLADLREYCGYRGYDYKKIVEEYFS